MEPIHLERVCAMCGQKFFTGVRPDNQHYYCSSCDRWGKPRYVPANAEKPTVMVIDLAGPAGNAYALMAQMKTWAKQLGVPKEEMDTTFAVMESSNYANLVDTMKWWCEEHRIDVTFMYGEE